MRISNSVSETTDVLSAGNQSSVLTRSLRANRSLKLIVAFLIIAVLIYMELNGGRSFFDEVLSIVSFFYLLFLAIKDELSRYDSVSLFMLLVVIYIGLISNVFSGISRSLTSILIDVVAETKVLWVFFAAKYLFRGQTGNTFATTLVSLAKAYIISAFACSIVSQVVNIGMTESQRYGLQGFRFVFPFSFQFMAVSLLAIAVLIKGNAKNRKVYFVLASISLMLATKSAPLLFGLLFLVLLYYFNHFKKLNAFAVSLLLLGVGFVGSYQIQTYLMNVNAPRYLFFLHGAELANRFFPLGAGFSTFGSDQAARVYSPLYYEFGFSYLFGLNPEDGSFLSDTFWPMAIGQFGWIAFVLLAILYLRIVLGFKEPAKHGYESKAFLYAAFFSYMIHAVGSAILSSSAGVIGFIALGLVCSSCDNKLIGDNRFSRVGGI